MKSTPVFVVVLVLYSLLISGCETQAGETPHHEPHQIVVTSPKAKDVVITRQYVCQIHSRRHIEICALEDGYLERIPIKEGQAVKSGDLLFKILPTLYRAKLDAELAEVQTAQLELVNSKKLFSDKVVSHVDVALHEAKLAKAQAEANLAAAELSFASITAPFDGIVDRLHEQQGSLVEEGDMLTTLSDNSVMWVYFNVPEARYLEYMAGQDRGDDDTVDADAGDAVNIDQDDDDADDDEDDDQDADDDDDQDADGRDDDRSVESQVIQLVLADGSTFPQPGKIGAIEANFNNETGNISFRADFPNPDGLLRHGQTGKVLIQRTLKDAIVIPQRAVFEILAKRYVYIVDNKGKVHQREIVVQNELEDIFVIGEGVGVDDKIILEGGRQVRDGETVEYEFLAPEEALGRLKHKAE